MSSLDFIPLNRPLERSSNVSISSALFPQKETQGEARQPSWPSVDGGKEGNSPRFASSQLCCNWMTLEASGHQRMVYLAHQNQTERWHSFYLRSLHDLQNVTGQQSSLGFFFSMSLLQREIQSWENDPVSFLDLSHNINSYSLSFSPIRPPLYSFRSSPGGPSPLWHNPHYFSPPSSPRKCH